MSALSPILKQTILELQNLPSIAQFALAVVGLKGVRV